MKIAIIGIQGLPAKYGGFETLTENLVEHTADGIIKYTVFCSSRFYKVRNIEYKGAKLIYLPLSSQGIQSIFYDVYAVIRSIKNHDKLLMLGVSGSVVLPLLPSRYRKKIIVNIDGLEHSRDKWSPLTKKILLYLEKMAVKYANSIIADNSVIQKYVKKKYGKESELIEYGGDHAIGNEVATKGNHYFSVCRIEPENNIHLILKAFQTIPYRLIIIGNWNSSEYSLKLKQKYTGINKIELIDPIYDLKELNKLRSSCKWYIHGHSAGGTNPSLVEAMNLGLNVLSFDVNFNRETTEDRACYFKDTNDLIRKINLIEKSKIPENGSDMKEIALRRYTWQEISKKYLRLFCK